MRRLLLVTALLTLSVPATADAATRWVVKGGGWGHGLGMSQYGAYGQALDGRGYRKILHHYYRSTQFGQAGGKVRVLLLASVGSSTFGGADRVGSHSVKPGRNYIVRRVGSRIVVKTPRGKRIARSSGVIRVTGANGLVTVAGKGVYRDVIEYRPGLSGGVTAVNRVELENYIRGVVPNESPGSWPIEALKAQAVAARSYALGTGTGNAVFDHYDTVASQVYGGYSSEQAKTNRAVARTRGEVLRSAARSSSPTSTRPQAATPRTTRTSGAVSRSPTSGAFATPGITTPPTTAGRSRIARPASATRSVSAGCARST